MQTARIAQPVWWMAFGWTVWIRSPAGTESFLVTTASHGSRGRSSGRLKIVSNCSFTRSYLMWLSPQGRRHSCVLLEIRRDVNVSRRWLDGNFTTDVLRYFLFTRYEERKLETAWTVGSWPYKDKYVRAEQSEFESRTWSWDLLSPPPCADLPLEPTSLPDSWSALYLGLNLPKPRNVSHLLWIPVPSYGCILSACLHDRLFAYKTGITFFSAFWAINDVIEKGNVCGGGNPRSVSSPTWQNACTNKHGKIHQHLHPAYGSQPQDLRPNGRINSPIKLHTVVLRSVCHIITINHYKCGTRLWRCSEHSSWGGPWR